MKLSEGFYSPSEVAALARVHRSTILAYIHSGRLTAVRLSARTYRIPRRAVLKLLAPDTVQPPRVRVAPVDAVPEPGPDPVQEREPAPA